MSIQYKLSMCCLCAMSVKHEAGCPGGGPAMATQQNNRCAVLPRLRISRAAKLERSPRLPWLLWSLVSLRSLRDVVLKDCVAGLTPEAYAE